jgi:hypothetical protein
LVVLELEPISRHVHGAQKHDGNSDRLARTPVPEHEDAGVVSPDLKPVIHEGDLFVQAQVALSSSTRKFVDKF